jgi:hypothetical protein
VKGETVASAATLAFLPSPTDLTRQLAEADPGPDLIVLLGLIDLDLLDADDRLYIVQAWERVAAWVAACAQEAMAAYAGPVPPEGDPELGRDCLAAALRLSRSTAQSRMDHARARRDLLPGTTALLASGNVSERHACEIAGACKDLTVEQAAAVEQRILPRAADFTLAELRPRLRRAVAAADPQSFESAHAQAAAKRRVAMWAEPDGMATVSATLPAADAKTVYLALDTLARVPGSALDQARAAGVGIDARRADALVQLARAALDDPSLPLAHGRRVQVQLVIDTPTLLGLIDQPAELVGYGPIPASVARALAADSAWHRLVVEPVTGHLLDFGKQAYRPPQALKDFLVARDVTCQFPGCRLPAFRSELDHIVPFGRAGGRTSAPGMCVLCKRHHQAKTRHGWLLERLPDGGLQWTSPSGRVFGEPQADHRPDG